MVFSYESRSTLMLMKSTRLYKVIVSWIMILFTLTCHVYAAQTSRLDSLISMLESVESDAQRLTTLNEIVPQIIKIDVERSIQYAEEAVSLAEDVAKNQPQQVEALYNLGHVRYDSNDRNSSIVYYIAADSLAGELGMHKLQAHALMSIAKFHRYVTKDSARTNDYFLKSLELSLEQNLTYEIARSYAKLASFFTKYNRVDLCEQYLEKSAIYYLKLEGGEKEIAHYYNEVGDKLWSAFPAKSMDLFLVGMDFAPLPKIKANLARAYSLIGDYQTSLKYLEEAIPFFRKESNSMYGISTAQLAEVYFDLGQIELADQTCDEALAFLDLLGVSDQKAMPNLLRIKGLIAAENGDQEGAMKYFDISQKEASRVHNSFARVKSQITAGIIISETDPEQGRIWCDKAYQSSRKHGYTNLEIESCDCLVSVLKKQERFEEALDYYQKKVILSDSLSTTKVKHALEVNEKLLLKDQEIAEQAYQAELEQQKFTILLITSFFGLLVMIFLAYSYRRVKKLNKIIQQNTVELESVNIRLETSNSELERFAYIASHDLKSPLKNMISFTSLLELQLKDNINPKVKSAIEFIKSSGRQMNILIEDVLEYSKFSNQNTLKKIDKVNLNSLIEEILEFIQPESEQRVNIFDIGDLPEVTWSRHRLFILFKNIFENGLKYNQSDTPRIGISGERNEHTFSIFIEDNGIGIGEKYQDQIFEMFQRLHTQDEYEGTGLGLATCKKIVDEFQGKISITSELGKGSIFEIQFPIDMIFSPDDPIQPHRPVSLSFPASNTE